MSSEKISANASLAKSIWVAAISLCMAFSGCDGGKHISAVGPTPGPTLEAPRFKNSTLVTAALIQSQPDWNPSKPLPKSVDVLAKIVSDAYLPSSSQPKTGWTLNSLTFFHVPDGMWPALKNSNHEAFKNKWYCRLYISAYGDYQGDWWKNNVEANVLLDGTIISLK